MKIGIKQGVAALLAVAGGFALYKYVTKSKSKVDREVVLRILKEIKYQMFTACISYVEAIISVKSKLKAGQNPTQVTEYFKAQMIKIFEQKQKLVLKKHNIQSVDFTHALEKVFKNDKQLNQLQQEIEALMLESVEGRSPNCEVSAQLKKQYTIEKIFELFRQMLIVVSQEVIGSFEKQLALNKDYDMNDNEQFLRVVRSISIYDVKMGFLKDKGFDKHEGCPNQNFSKLIQLYKKADGNFKIKIKQLEFKYEKMVEQLATNFENVSKQKAAAELNTITLKQELKQIVINKPINQPRQNQQKPAVDQSKATTISREAAVNKLVEQENWFLEEVPKIVQAPPLKSTKSIIEKAYQEQLWYQEYIEPQMPLAHLKHQPKHTEAKPTKIEIVPQKIIPQVRKAPVQKPVQVPVHQQVQSQIPVPAQIQPIQVKDVQQKVEVVQQVQKVEKKPEPSQQKHIEQDIVKNQPIAKQLIQIEQPVQHIVQVEVHQKIVQIQQPQQIKAEEHLQQAQQHLDQVQKLVKQVQVVQVQQVQQVVQAQVVKTVQQNEHKHIQQNVQVEQIQHQKAQQPAHQELAKATNQIVIKQPIHQQAQKKQQVQQVLIEQVVQPIYQN